MAEMTDAQIEAANARGRIVRETQPHTKAARYDAKTGRVVIDLTNGATFAFPTPLVEGLHNASPAQIAEVEILGGGFGLHWETLDLDYTVPGLINGVFGTAKWMAAKAGRVSSPAKTAAARMNGAKGGWPRKARVKKPIGTTARTGELCPESGVWKPANCSTTAPIANGNRMPPYNGAATTWALVRYA